MLGHQKILAIRYADQLSLGKPSNPFSAKILMMNFVSCVP
jgi:hypothetical protein